MGQIMTHISLVPLKGLVTPVRMREGVKRSVLSVCQFVCLSVCSVKNVKSKYRQG